LLLAGAYCVHVYFVVLLSSERVLVIV
jgi:hypothetical protein